MRLRRTFFIFYLSTFEKEFRSKIFWVILILTGLFIVVSAWIYHWLVPEAIGSLFFAKKNTIYLIYVLLSFWSSILAGFFGVRLIRSDMEEGTLRQFLTFSVRRHEYLTARLLGGLRPGFFLSPFVRHHIQYMLL